MSSSSLINSVFSHLEKWIALDRDAMEALARRQKPGLPCYTIQCNIVYYRLHYGILHYVVLYAYLISDVYKICRRENWSSPITQGQPDLVVCGCTRTSATNMSLPKFEIEISHKTFRGKNNVSRLTVRRS